MQQMKIRSRKTCIIPGSDITSFQSQKLHDASLRNYMIKVVAGPHGWDLSSTAHVCRNIAVVTSAFHMPRTRQIFDKCFNLAGKSRAAAFRMSYSEASDAGTMPPEVLHARAEKEHRALKVFPPLWTPCMVPNEPSRLHAMHTPE